ncbi:MAG TPA: ABC transporter ATP-binding protein [Desulfobacterales bacterium]|nr:ABC transporter ATP-binding protein [Desulfobacterales bacterium]
MPLLEIKNIETYYDLIYALRGVSLDVEEGIITAILGNNGAGKSTILKTVMGLIEDQPDKGTILFMGKRIDGKETEDIVRMGISFVPEGREVFEELTVKENLLMGAYIRKDRSSIKQDFEMIYQHFPVLREREGQWAGTLSGGEQQMLAIGRALMSKPKLLMLDEPSLGLSPLLVKEIFHIIKEINKQGATILLVEQNARMALGISQFALILENGRFVMKGSSKELMEDKDVKEFYLGIRSEESIKGFQRWKRKKRWR